MSPDKKIKGTKPGATHVVGAGGLDAKAFAVWYRERMKAQWDGLDLEAIARLAEAVVAAQEAGRSVYVMGNGGSAATASHWATDLSKTAEREGHPPLRCVSLADNVAYITAIGNDLSFDEIFARQLENLLQKGDLVVLISGSGNSPNLLRAAELARERGARVAALLGFDGGKLLGLAHVPVLVASDQYGCVEDVHMSIGHIVAFYLKQRARP